MTQTVTFLVISVLPVLQVHNLLTSGTPLSSLAWLYELVQLSLAAFLGSCFQVNEFLMVYVLKHGRFLFRMVWQATLKFGHELLHLHDLLILLHQFFPLLHATTRESAARN